jgi:threonine dehydrogenase-like Zn-dependent dehydrogenase
MPRFLELSPSVASVVATRALGAIDRRAAGLAIPLRLVRREKRDGPRPPAEGWAPVTPRLAGICGSDLATLCGATSLYFEPLVSTPFVPGHEVVGELAEDSGDFRRGERVILDPVLGCAARGTNPPCPPCAAEEPGRCERVTAGHVGAGLQTGYCHDTGGGWGEALLAHRTQLHRAPERLSDRAAVLVEPAACAIRSVRRAAVPEGATVLVVGMGTVGILTLLALRALARPGRVVAVAKHAAQAALAREYGAVIAPPDQALGAVRRATSAFRLDPAWSPPFLLGGADVAFDCAGSRSSLDLALRATRAGGRVILTAMPAGVDLTPAWFRELEVVGSYSGTGAFDDAIELAGAEDLGRLVSGVYPLERWSDAVEHALDAGERGAFKIAFAPGRESE